MTRTMSTVTLHGPASFSKPFERMLPQLVCVWACGSGEAVSVLLVAMVSIASFFLGQTPNSQTTRTRSTGVTNGDGCVKRRVRLRSFNLGLGLRFPNISSIVVVVSSSSIIISICQQPIQHGVREERKFCVVSCVHVSRFTRVHHNLLPVFPG